MTDWVQSGCNVRDSNFFSCRNNSLRAEWKYTAGQQVKTQIRGILRSATETTKV